MTEAKTLLRLAALAAMWGSSFFWIKLGLAAFTPVQLVLIRLVLGALVLGGLCLAYRDRLPATRRLWKHLAVAAMFHNALPFLLFAIGEQTVDSGLTGVINATTPLWVVLVAFLWRTEGRLSGPKLVGLVLGFTGVMLIFAPWQSSGGLLSVGALLCLAAAASYGFVFVYEGKYLTGVGVSPFALAAAQMMTATGFMLFAVPVGGLEPIDVDGTAFVAVAVLGVLSTGFAFALNYRVLADIGAVASSVVGYLLPVVSVLLGSVFLGETLTLRVVLGMAVVLAGVALTRMRTKPDLRPRTADLRPRTADLRPRTADLPSVTVNVDHAVANVDHAVAKVDHAGANVDHAGVGAGAAAGGPVLVVPVPPEPVAAGTEVQGDRVGRL